MQIIREVKCRFCGQGLWDAAEGQTVRCPECGRVNRPARAFTRCRDRRAAWLRYAICVVGPGVLPGCGAYLGTSRLGPTADAAAVVLLLFGGVAIVAANIYIQGVIVDRYLGPPYSRSVLVRCSWIYSFAIAMAFSMLIELLR